MEIISNIKDELNNLECWVEEEHNKLETIREILDQAEYGIINHRNLETKQDLIDTIRKEVLDEQI